MASVSGESALSVGTGAASGAVVGTAFGPIGTAVGAGLGAIYGGLTGWWSRSAEAKERKKLEANARKSAGASAKALATVSRTIKEQGLAVERGNVALLNQEWGGAGRYASGARMKAISGLSEKTQAAITNAIAEHALQAYQFNVSTEEERAWRQAQLDANAKSSRAESVGELVGGIASIYGQNPEYWNKTIGNKFGGGQPSQAGITPPDIPYAVEPEIPEAQLAPSNVEAQNQLAPAIVPTKLTEMPAGPPLQERVNPYKNQVPIIPTMPATREPEPVDMEAYFNQYYNDLSTGKATVSELAHDIYFLPAIQGVLGMSEKLNTSADWAKMLSELWAPNADVDDIMKRYIGGE